jgi:DNA-directed RNA polymerase specialized sigma24 family protein
MQNIELIEGCAHNDKTAQKAFFDSFSNIVMGTSMRYSSAEKDAVPMSIFIFKSLFAEIRDIPKDTELSQWIAERSIWNAIKYLHQDKHKFFIAKTTLYEENKPVFEEVNEAELPQEACRAAYLAALQSLTPSYRILYNLTYIDSIPSDNIIARLEIAPETYKAELDEARYQFKKQLNKRLHEQKLRRG